MKKRKGDNRTVLIIVLAIFAILMGILTIFNLNLDNKIIALSQLPSQGVETPPAGDGGCYCGSTPCGTCSTSNPGYYCPVTGGGLIIDEDFCGSQLLFGGSPLMIKDDDSPGDDPSYSDCDDGTLHGYCAGIGENSGLYCNDGTLEFTDCSECGNYCRGGYDQCDDDNGGCQLSWYCEDGTPSQSCSEVEGNEGLYCNSEYVLKVDCTLCGSYCWGGIGACTDEPYWDPIGCENEGDRPGRCEDGTYTPYELFDDIHNGCSDASEGGDGQPWRCIWVDGQAEPVPTLVEDCLECGCPSGQNCIPNVIGGSICVSPGEGNYNPPKDGSPGFGGSVPPILSNPIGETIEISSDAVLSSLVSVKGLGKNDTIIFVGGERILEGHTIRILNVGTYNVKIEVRSSPQIATLDIGKCKIFEFIEEDITVELNVCLKGISNLGEVDLELNALIKTKESNDKIIGAGKKLFTELKQKPISVNQGILGLVIVIAIVVFITFVVILFKGKNDKKRKNRKRI